MAETTLRAYLDELNHLLEQEALEEVIGHCRHILQHFPKNVETYRLLGTALLEKGRHKEAGDVFQRILSALPDDFTSHLGMAAVGEEAGQFPTAIWHLERAFEQQSSNPQLQGELKRLYERRDGRAPERIQLTHGALVRVYVKGQLYDQAMTELRSALAESPDRVDLELLQAQVLWNTERTVEAAEVALGVLEKLPNSLEANRILASLWLRSGHTAEAAPFISRLEQLDPFLAWQVVQDGKELPRDAFRLQRLAWDARAASMLAADVPDWVSAISNVFDAPESVSLSSSTSDWVADSSPTLPSSPTQLKKKTNRLDKLRTGEYTAASAPAEPPAEIPDWLGQMPAAAGFAAPSAEEVPDWFKDVGNADIPAASGSATEMGGVELPDWFDEVVSTPAEAEAPAAALPSWMDDDASGSADSQFPSGFTDLLSGATSTASAGVADSAALPDWMSDDDALNDLAAAEPSQTLDAMSWLNTGPLPPLEQAVSSTAPSDTGTSTESALDWMSTLDAPEAEDSATALFAEPAQPTEADWLSDISFVTGDTALTSESQIEAAQPAESMPDWLDSFPASELEVAESTASVEATSPIEELNWLNDMSPETPGMAIASEVEAAQPALPVDSVPDWLGGMSPLTDEAEPVAAQPAQSAQPGLEDLDWLGGTAEAEPLAFDSEPQLDSPLQMDDMGGSDLFAASGRKVGTGPLDWMTGVASEEPEPPLPVEDDPMAWLRPYQETAPNAENAILAQSSAQPIELESSDFSLDTSLDTSLDNLGEPINEPTQAEGPPAWLTALMPTSDEPPAPLPSLADLPTYEDDAPAQPPADWLSAPPTPEPSKPATGGLDWLAATAQPAEIEDDWLASFEVGTGSLAKEPQANSLESSAAPAADNWLAQMAEAPAQPTAEPATDNWFDSLAASQPEPQIAAETGGDNWLDSFATSEPETPAEPQMESPQEPQATGLRRWTTMLQPLDTPAPDAALASQPVDDKPAWMQDLESVGDSVTAESSDWLADVVTPQEQEPDEAPPRFTRTLPSKSTQETGVLNTDVLPDWLSALGDESAPSLDDAPVTSTASAQLSPDWLEGAMFDETTDTASNELALGVGAPSQATDMPSWIAEPAVSGSSTSDELGLDSLDFGQLQVSGEADDQDAGGAPDWLSAMAPAQAAPASGTSLDDLDFGSLQVGEHEISADPGETPDWLSAMAPAQAAPASATPLDALDFSSLQFGEQSAATEAEATPESASVPSWLDEEMEKASTAVDFTEVAQPANLVNTNVTSGDQPAPSFTFKQPPAWKRRLGGSAAPQAGDDIPDWLQDPSEPDAG